VDGYTVEEAAAQGVDVSAALRTHAASAALWKLRSGVWATQNISVNDIILLLVMDHDG
jgi:post-segregation antitoxin (ccd killing protein)